MIETPLVAHLSPSAVKQYFQSPAKFWHTYVAKSAFTSSFTMERGTAWHKGVESLCLGMSVKNAQKSACLQLIHGYNALPDTQKDPDALALTLKKLEENLELYDAEEKLWKLQKENGEVEKFIECKGFYKFEEENVLPMKGKMDALVELDGAILALIWKAQESEECPFKVGELYKGVLDHKYVSKNEGQAGEGGSKFFHAVQAHIYYYLYQSLTGHFPDFFVIGQFKESKNRDKSSQYTEKYIFYTDKFIKKMDTFYKYLCEDILSRKHFLPNPFQSYGGEDWREFLTSDNALI